MLNIKVEGRPIRIRDTEWFCTVFSEDDNEMPQDFDDYNEAVSFADSRYGRGHYHIESPF